MIILLIILVVAAIGGVGAYVAMQYASPSVGAPSGSGSPRYSGGWESHRGGALSERIADAPSGCLVAVILAVTIWVVLWAIVLVLGLRVLTA